VLGAAEAVAAEAVAVVVEPVRQLGAVLGEAAPE